MSLLLYSKIPGTQVKRDVNLSNATIQCDPTLLFPQGATQSGVPLNKQNLAGKIAVEHDICNLDVNNLTVNGVLKAKGPAQICDIVCPQDFTVTAGNDIIETAAANMNLTATAGTITGTAGVAISLTSSDMNLTATAGTITGTAGGAISLTSSDKTDIQSTGLLAGDGSINLNSSANATGTGGQIVLSAGATTNNFDTSGVEVNGQNIRSVAATSAATSGGALNVFPRVPGAKGLSVVCKDTIQGEFGIAADLTGTTILRADGTGLNTGATGHLMSAPSGVDLVTFAPNAVDVTFTPGNNVSAVGVLGNCTDTCGTVIVEPTASGVNTTLTVTFAKRFPTPFVNVQITAADRFGASCTSVHTGSVAAGNEATGFTLNFVSGAATALEECFFHYFVMDVVGVSQQHG